jgi:hypothetical protein
MRESQRKPTTYPPDWKSFRERLQQEEFTEIIIFTGVIGDTDQVQRQEIIRSDRVDAEYFARRWALEIRDELAVDVHYFIRTYRAISYAERYGDVIMGFLGEGI